MNTREYERWTQDEVSEWPGVSVAFEDGGKHKRACLKFGDAEQFVTYSATPGDTIRGIHNHVGEIRRTLREMGAERSEQQKAEPKPYSKPNGGRDAREPALELAAPQADPWEALQELARRPLINTAGAYPDIDEADYHRNASLLPGPSLSSSGAKTILNKSPRHFWFDSPMNPDRPEVKDKPHFNVGKAAHDLVLLADRWPEAYFVLPETFNANATKAQAEWHAEREAARDAGKVILKHDEAETVKAVAMSIAANPLAMKLLINGEPEVTLAWQDKETGVWLRARPDFLPTKRLIIPDLKFMADGSRKTFSRSIANNGYALSAAMYLDGIHSVFGGSHFPHWIHVVVEKEAPHVVALYELPAEDIARGRWLYRNAVRQFAECLNSGVWPGYSDAPSLCGLPGWERKAIDEADGFDAANKTQTEWMGREAA